MSGSNGKNQQGYYGIKGKPNESNMPPAREYGMGCTDSNGNLLLFGGAGAGKIQYDSNMNFVEAT
jgi:hypothetical protein